MPDPVIEQIADTLVARLQAVTAANSYAITVAEVVRPDRKGAATSKDYGVIVEQLPPERNEELTRACATGLQVAWDVEFQITCLIRPSDDDTTAIDQLGNIALSELTRGIATPTASWHTFGNKAINATFAGQEQISDESGASVKLRLQVTYRTDEHDPRQERL